MIYVIQKKAKIRNRYNQVPNLTQDNTWESDITQENITYKRAKRPALSQQVARPDNMTEKNINNKKGLVQKKHRL